MTPQHRRQAPSHAVCIDLRASAQPYAGKDALHSVVAEALETPYHGGERRFLVIDDASALVSHQLLYEQLYSYGPATLICLAVGAGDERTLRRPLTLRPPAAGVLWLLDASGGAAGPAAAGRRRAGLEEALRPLAELLADPMVFDSVLHGVGEVVHGVAVPAVRVLEHDLTDDARTRSWRQALDSLIGQDGPAPPLGDSVPAELALLLGDSVPRSLEGRAWLQPGGRAEALHRECGAALRSAADGHERIRRWTGLFATRAGEADLPGRLERLSTALAGYQEVIAGALADGGGVRLTAEQRGRLAERGVALPEIPEVSRGSVGPGLRGFTENLLARRLPLRAVAARLAALSGRSAPAGSAARLARLDEICDRDYLLHLTRPEPFTAGGSRRVAAAVAFTLAFLAGLWPGLGWLLGPLGAVCGAGLAALMLRRRPNRSPDGRLDGGGSTGSAPRLLGGLAGGLGGALTGQLAAPPLWAAAAALALSLLLTAALALRSWTAAVDAWWQAMEPEHSEQIVAEVDQLLIETAVHDWLLADARYHCSDGARTVSLLLRGLADAAERHAPDGPPPGTRGRGGMPAAASGAAKSASDAWGWDTWGDSPADDGWLDALSAPPGEPPREPAERPRHAETAPHAEPAGQTGQTAHLGFESLHDRRAPAPQRHADGHREPTAHPAWLERELGDGGPLLVDTLVADLMDAVVRIVTPCWAAVEQDPAGAARIRLEGPMAEALDEVHGRLLRDGAASPPPFAHRPEQRPGAPELLGVPADRLTWLLGADGVAEQAMPLCGAEHRRMLSKDPAAVRQVRFVPEAMRRGADHDETPDHWRTAPEDVVWTAAGRHAGLLRLVPLRTETVRTVRGEEGSAP
ncbi:hypothetical protein [Streptomyces sp. MUM 178J]|uniref:hypothetical protein n=1 Tax=Streptomyces sp. MUM 178J TaxID=2791991 RepID=UPI001F04A6EA|nr:hypothetical protein [Streptomyces sp. MUM 178J]WRQ80633.1 hypothetical protein I3F59_015410 [Streptomyces sp. MUM 178J]